MSVLRGWKMKSFPCFPENTPQHRALLFVGCAERSVKHSIPKP